MKAFILWIGVLLAAVGVWAAQPPALMLAGTGLVPVRAVAPWLGATIETSVNPPGLILTHDKTYLTTIINTTLLDTNAKLAATTMPAPACVLDGITYLPARTLGEVFGLTVAWDAPTATLTLSGADTPPLSFPVVPFPRPACVKDETLAGLTPGDRLAYAVALWGDGVEEEKNSLPGATDYTFTVDPAGGITLTVSVKDEVIVCISTDRTGTVASKKIDPRWLKKAGTSKQLTLTGNPLRIYGREVTIANGDQVYLLYRLGSLQMLCTYPNDGMVLEDLCSYPTKGMKLGSLTLARKTTSLPQIDDIDIDEQE